MSELETAAAEVGSLITLLPGVIVSEIAIADDVCSAIELETVESVATLQRIALGANVTFRSRAGSSELEWRDEAVWVDRPLELLAAFSPGQPCISLGYLQLLGIHLVWSLHRQGRMTQDVANLLLRKMERCFGRNVALRYHLAARRCGRSRGQTGHRSTPRNSA